MGEAVHPAAAPLMRLALSPLTRRKMRTAARGYRPLERLGTGAWAEKYRTLATGAVTGPYRLSLTPVLRGILAAYDDPAVDEIVAMKPAQIGWTQGLVMNVIGRHIHLDPCAMLVLFSKDKAGSRFMREKFEPTALATPVLAERLELGSRNPANTQDYKAFPGGFLQLAGSNSPANVKSTDFRVVIVEEPDDASHDVRGQGDAITLSKERNKTYHNRKNVIGGTPTIEELSAIAEEMKITDQRRFYVRCPHCGHEQTLRWDQVMWLKDALIAHPVYGVHQPETARYACEDCGALWSDAEKNAAIVAAAQRPDYGWRATASFTGAAGFYLNELYSIFSASRMEVLARKFLEAVAKQKEGNDEKMRVFVNSTKGEPWKLKSDAPEIEDLRQRAEDYAEWTTPAGGLVCTASVDVQRGGEHSVPRLELKVKAWGRGEESWLVAYVVIPGNPLEQAPWDALDAELNKPIKNAGGGVLGISAVSIDSSDGMTSEAVYAYVRKRKSRNFMAVKGFSRQGKGGTDTHKEIFSPPKQSVDTQAQDKAARHGLRPFIVGVDKAKDLIAGRIKFTGQGPGRLHWHHAVPADYFDQLTSEVKIPGKNGRAVWTKKAGKRNEALDLEVMNLHAARKLRLHTWTETDWARVEAQVRQRELWTPPEQLNAPVRVEIPEAPGRPAVTSIGGAKPFTGFAGQG